MVKTGGRAHEAEYPFGRAESRVNTILKTNEMKEAVARNSMQAAAPLFIPKRDYAILRTIRMIASASARSIRPSPFASAIMPP